MIWQILLSILQASAVSHTYNTTRVNLIGCINEGTNQLVLVDTPGMSTIHTLRKHKIKTSILHKPSQAVENCDAGNCFSGLNLKWGNSLLEN